MKKFLIEFPKKYPIIFNMILIMMTFFVIMYGVLCIIDSFTDHGEYVTVPNITGLSIDDATAKLEMEGFKWEITDSAYNKNLKPGCVIDQEPKENSNVKALRTIYITMNAVAPRIVSLPNVNDMSQRQGVAMLEGIGFKSVNVDCVPSPYKDLIVGVKVKGVIVEPGTRLPVNSIIYVQVGDGYQCITADTLELDESEMELELEYEE